MSSLIECKSCKELVSKDAKSCPKCGAPVKKGQWVWVFWKIFGLFCVLLFIVGRDQRGQEGKEGQRGDSGSENSQDIASAPVDKKFTETLYMMKLASIYRLGSDYTDLQREETEKEIKGKIVMWTLRVFEVKRVTDGYYRIQTGSPSPFSRVLEGPGTFIRIRNPPPYVVERLMQLKTDDVIAVKGRIEGVSLRHVVLDPAVLLP